MAERGARTLSGLPAGSITDLRPASLPSQGDGGGGFSSDGGFVDSGPIAFDTAGYDWGPYAAEMIRKIKRNWEVPALARYGVKGWVRIRFFIRRDGTVEGTQIVASSGVPPFDNSALQAILRSSPLRPLPADLSHEREGVTITFYYNLDPADVAG
jgi:TonB family protein